MKSTNVDLHVLIQPNQVITYMPISQNNGKPKSLWVPPTHASHNIISQREAPVNTVN